jgi:predicted glycosyltransferase
MKIWIDFINTPQVTFFVPFITEFKKDHHEVLLSCRDSSNTVDLLKQYNLQFHIIGEKVGTGIIQKLLFFPKRLVKLYFFIRKQKPDIAVSQSSFYQPIVARILKIPCLYTNDNEHAKGNIFGFLFATKVVLPSVLQNEKLTKKWPQKNKIIFYPGIKEAIYLSQQPELLSHTNKKKSKIYFRPEPRTAQYYSGPLNFFDNTLLDLSKEFPVIILPRDKNQNEYYIQDKFKTLTVAQKPLALIDIVSDCMLFIGAGGSMTRELSILGIPVISIYQEKMLRVDQYLVDKGLMMINPYFTYKDYQALLGTDLGSENKWSVLNEGKTSNALIKSLIYALKNE